MMNLESFLNNIVFGWIKNDLERMITRIPTRNGLVGNINFPLALCVLAYIEYLGGFLLGEDKGFSENATAYIEQCFIESSHEYPVDILRDIFRNGLAHEYFARGAISRDGLRPAMFYEPRIGAILDVETLVNDFLKSLEQFKLNLKEENYVKRVNCALQKIEETKNRYNLNSLPTRIKEIRNTSTKISIKSDPAKNTMTLDPTVE